MERKEFAVGDLVRMRKKHPCGSHLWSVLRMGADIKMKCQACGRMVMLTRREFEHGLIEVVSHKEEG